MRSSICSHSRRIRVQTHRLLRTFVAHTMIVLLALLCTPQFTGLAVFVNKRLRPYVRVLGCVAHPLEKLGSKVCVSAVPPVCLARALLLVCKCGVMCLC